MRLFFVALFAGVLLLSACGPSDDDTADTDDAPIGGGPFPVGTLEVTVTHPDRDDVSYTISCLGDTATITPAVDGLSDVAACEQLADPAVQTLLVDGPPADRVCTEIYGGPDEARFVGSIDDQPVDTLIVRNNGCGISDWDDTLSAVLPTAVGAAP